MRGRVGCVESTTTPRRFRQPAPLSAAKPHVESDRGSDANLDARLQKTIGWTEPESATTPMDRSLLTKEISGLFEQRDVVFV